MNMRTIGTLIIILALLSGLYYFENAKRIDQEESELRQLRVMPFDVDKADAIFVQSKYGKFELEKRKDGWWITNPMTDRADQSLINEKMLAELKQSQKTNPFTIKRTDETKKDKASDEAKSYGFDKSAVTILVRSSAQGKNVRLCLGAESPIKGESYLIDESEPDRVFTVASSLRNAFAHDLDTIRDKDVMEFDPATISSFWLTRPSGSVSGRKAPAGKWNIETRETSSTKSHQTLADAGPVEEMLQKVQAAKAEDFATSVSVAPADFGLAEAQITLEVRQDEKATTERAHSIGPLLIGNPVPTAPGESVRYYAMQRGRNAVFTISGDIVSTLMKPAAGYRDRRIFTLLPPEVDYLQIEAISSTISFSRDATGQWRFASDESKDLDQDKIKSYIAYCLSLNVEEYPDPAITDAKSVMLNKPALRVTMANRDRTKRQGFEIGAAPKDTPFFYARRSPAVQIPDEPEIFLIGLPIAGFYALMRTQDDFLYRRLLTFDTDEVTSIVIHARKAKDGEVQLTISRKAGSTNEWQASFGTKETPPTPIAHSQVETFLFALSTIEFQKQANKPQGKDATPYSVELFNTTGELLAKTGFGDLSRSEQVVAESMGGKYYTVESKSFAPMAHALDEIMVKVSE